MFRSQVRALLFLVSCLPLFASPPRAAGAALAPSLGIRVREESLRNVYTFDPNENDRHWLRYRTRAGVRWQAAAEHAFEARLVNEFQKTYEPDTKLDYDEVIFDRLAWIWKREGDRPFTLTAGRQDIFWNDGFLVFDGTPLDGSRTAYQNAVRIELPVRAGTWDLALIANPKRDPIVLAGDEERALRDGDERAIALRFFTPSGWEGSLVAAGEKDPDRKRPDYTGWTVGLRREGKVGGLRRSLAEVALQRQAAGGDAGFAFAYHLSRAAKLGEKTAGEIGFFYYSGESANTKAYRPPYGRWPKWSEMLIYSLIGEGGVAEWSNLASPYVAARIHPLAKLRLLDRLAFRGMLLVPYAPEPNWEERGLLSELELQAAIAPGLTAHLLWEWYVRASYPEDVNENAHFLRWQVNYDLP